MAKTELSGQKEQKRRPAFEARENLIDFERGRERKRVAVAPAADQTLGSFPRNWRIKCSQERIALTDADWSVRVIRNVQIDVRTKYYDQVLTRAHVLYCRTYEQHLFSLQQGNKERPSYKEIIYTIEENEANPRSNKPCVYSCIYNCRAPVSHVKLYNYYVAEGREKKELN